MPTTQPPRLTPPAAGSSAWHFVPRRGSPPVMMGIIDLPGGMAPFVHPTESRATQPVSHKLDAQPAQFPYRNDWNHWDKPLREAGAGSKEQRSRLRINESYSDRRAKIQNLGASPMNAWRPISPGELSQLLDQKVDPETCLTESAFIVGLQFATYYAARDVLVASAALNCHKPPIRNPPVGTAGHVSAFSDDDLIPAMTLENMQKQSRLGYLTNRSLQQAQFDKQFTIIPIHHNVGSGHWTMAVFDRRVGHLLYWDPLQPHASDSDYQRKLRLYTKRARASVVAFKSYLTFNAQPNTFRVTVCSITAQRGSYECGHILCDIARQLFCGQTGLTHSDYTSIMTISSLGLPFESPATGGSRQVDATDLRLRDWVAEPFRCDDSAAVYWEHYGRMVDEWKVAIFGFLGSSDCVVEMFINGSLRTLKLKALRKVSPYWLTSEFESNPLLLEEAAFPPLGGRAHSAFLNSVDVIWYPHDRNFKLNDGMKSEMIRAGHARFQHPSKRERYPEPIVNVSHAAMEFLSLRGWCYDGWTLAHTQGSSKTEGEICNGPTLNPTQATSISSSTSNSVVVLGHGTTDRPPQPPTARHNVTAAPGGSKSSVCENQLSNSMSQMSLDTEHRPSSARGSLVAEDEMEVYMEDAFVQNSRTRNGDNNMPAGQVQIEGALVISRLEMQQHMIEAGRRGILESPRDEATQDMLLLSEELGLMPFPGTSAQLVGSTGNTFVLEDMPFNLISYTQDWPRLVNYARSQVDC